MVRSRVIQDVGCSSLRRTCRLRTRVSGLKELYIRASICDVRLAHFSEGREECLEGPDLGRSGPRLRRHNMSYVFTPMVTTDGQATERMLKTFQLSVWHLGISCIGTFRCLLYLTVYLIDTTGYFSTTWINVTELSHLQTSK